MISPFIQTIWPNNFWKKLDMIILDYFFHPTCYQPNVNHVFHIQGEVGTLERKEKVTI